MQDSSVLLLTHAQLSIAIAGFASVAATLRRPLTSLLAQRFLALLSLSFLQVLACLLPVWLGEFQHTEFGIWRICGLVMFVLYSCHLTFLVLAPMTRIGKTIGVVINPIVTALTWIAGTAAIITLGTFAFRAESHATFSEYYACNAVFLFTQFILFADVATADSNRHSTDA